MTHAEQTEKMRATARALSTAQVVAGVKRLGGGRLPTAETWTRAILIDVYAERAGEAAADLLMDQIGL
ncbi:hypothetical protein D3C80_1845420 [compost metagenome]